MKQVEKCILLHGDDAGFTAISPTKVTSSRAYEWHMSQVCHPYDLASRLCMQRVVQYVAVARLLNV